MRLINYLYNKFDNLVFYFYALLFYALHYFDSMYFKIVKKRHDKRYKQKDVL